MDAKYYIVKITRFRVNISARGFPFYTRSPVMAVDFNVLSFFLSLAFARCLSLSSGIPGILFSRVLFISRTYVCRKDEQKEEEEEEHFFLLM